MADKTSLVIGRLSPEAKAAMHSFLVFFNTGKMDDKVFDLNVTDQKTLSIVVQRIKLQNPVEEVNKQIVEFNKAKNLELELIK